ncbi:MAG TPA: hypothetical protein VEW93_08355 [Acidimicrobiales bacterium]|nr:hypothetical protein [Acidimicrobiales bacterium]
MTGPAPRPWERRGPAGDGRLLVRLSWAGTAVSCVTAVANAVTGDRDHYLLSAAPALAMLVLGSLAFLAAFALAVERSRTEAIGVGGLYFLSGCAPRAVQATMLASVAVQTVVPLAVTLVRPFVAFSVLAPVWSLGLAGLWGARHGTFPPRPAADGPECDPDDRRTEAPTDG